MGTVLSDRDVSRSIDVKHPEAPTPWPSHAVGYSGHSVEFSRCPADFASGKVFETASDSHSYYRLLEDTVIEINNNLAVDSECALDTEDEVRVSSAE